MGPEGTAPTHTDFPAPEIFRLREGVASVIGGPRGPTPPVRGRCPAGTEGVGMGGVENEAVSPPKFDRDRPLAPFWFLFGRPNAARTAPAGAFRSATAAQRRLLARRCGEIPLQKGKEQHVRGGRALQKRKRRKQRKTGRPDKEEKTSLTQKRKRIWNCFYSGTASRRAI